MSRLLIFLLMFIFLFGCGKKEKAINYVIIGEDTLTYESVRDIKSGGDSLNIVKRNAFLLAASKKSDKKINDNTLISDFKDRMELESGKEWGLKGAELFYITCRYLKESIAEKGEELSTTFSNVNNDISEEYRFIYKDSYLKNLPSDSAKSYVREDFEILFGRIFSLNERTSQVVGEFLFLSGDNKEKSVDVSKIVSGLVFDSAALKKKIADSSQKKSVNKVVDNSQSLIKYRSLESIKDSISSHSINIQSIYKKTLKIHEGLSGVVYVKFRVNESGSVVETAISRTEINNKELHENLMSYVRNIKFKAIPEGKGLMTFDFPFEFRPE